MDFNYMQPVKIIFGNGRLNELSALTKQFKGEGLLICDKFFYDNGLAKQILDNTPTINTLYYDVSPNPDTSEVDACSQLIRNNDLKFIVALGGGSVIDCAKVASTLALTNDSVTKYHGTGKELPSLHLPLIAIPTTAGTGSEVTCAAVLTNRELMKKAPINSDNFYPLYAIIDPELTYNIPKQITANTGMDVLCHALEGFWSKGHQPICDIFALKACKLVFDNLLEVYHNPDNKEARSNMCEASLLAGMAFSIPKTTSSHACSFPLTNIYGIPHGEACALTIDYFALINKDAKDKRLVSFVKELGFKDVEEMAIKIKEMKKEMKMRIDLKDLNISKDQLSDLISLSRHPNLYNNPVEITDTMLKDMYQSMI
ncbi:MAG: iron-containing alcohol dehydrogenase family protein [Thomasclavelia sp.]|jgi:alcohol dehydrogenase class IV|nr:iron-containing alcohol dehydrogenase family protein [Thomasclavelia sp.]